MLDRLFASVDLANGKNRLPVNFPLVIKDGSIVVQVDVVDRLDAKGRRVRVGVDFVLQLQIGSGATKEVNASLATMPLVAQGDHHLRIDLSVPDSDDALSLLELTSAVGLGKIPGTVPRDIPLIKELLDIVRERTVSAGMPSTASGWQVSNWSVEVELADFNVILDRVLVTCFSSC